MPDDTQTRLRQLKKGYDDLNARVSFIERHLDIQDKEVASVPKQDVVVAATAKASKETSSSTENFGFKAFGGVGFFLILLGLFYLYRYAVDNGFLGIGGRIVLGVIFSLAIMVVGEVFRRKEYNRFGQLLTGGGLALLYFTIYATYHFSQYRAALGMTLWLNTALLLLVMIIGVILSLRQDSILLGCFSFLLGYLSTLFLASGHQAIITAIILSIGYSFIVWKRSWPVAPYPIIAAYLLYAVYYWSEKASPWISLLYLVILFGVFSVLGYAMRKEKLQPVITSSLNGFFMLLFCTTLSLQYWNSAAGLLPLIIAIVHYLFAVSVKDDNKVLANTLFSAAVVAFTISIPAQLNHSWITVAWAAEGLLLLYAASKTESNTLRVLGFIATVLTLVKILFWDSFMMHYPDRTYSTLFVICAAYASSYMLANIKDDDLPTISRIGAVILTAVFFAIEINDPQGLLAGASNNTRQVVLSILWALTAVVLMVAGVVRHSRTLRTCGVVLFAITVLKILVVDLSALTTISRVLVTIVVGIVALLASFFYVKNKDKLEDILHK